MRLSELAEYVDTDLVRVVRDCEVTSAELCAAVKGPAAVTYLEKEKFLPDLEREGIAAVLCTEELADRLPAHIRGVLVSDAPKFAFYRIHNHFARETAREPEPTVIGEGAQIAPTAYIAPKGVKIGRNVRVEPGAVIHEYVSIGEGTRVCAGAVVGAQSFNPARYKDRALTLEDCGAVDIGGGVLICSQAVVARGVLPGEITKIGDGVKIDTFVHTAHGVHIGACAFVASGAVLGGNCRIGRDVWVGINATVRNRVRVGDGARVSMGAAVTKDVPAGMTVSGNFAIEHRRFLRNLKASLSESEDDESMPPPRTL